MAAHKSKLPDLGLPRILTDRGVISRLGEVARELECRRTLLVADHGLCDAGHVDTAARCLHDAGIEVFPFHDFDVNPDTVMVEAGRVFAGPLGIDSIVGLGGGTSMDCAKGINFLLTNGGRMQDYWGYGKASKPMLPMIAVPTTAGTGSEAQTYALISDAVTHVKMACGDRKAAFRAALLDPELAATAPAAVRAVAGYDAISHAVETFVTTRRSALSESFSREAWRLLDVNFERVLAKQDDLDAIAAMQMGAFLAGAAIECSMLGATHACANPLTARYGTPHGVAIAALLPHVVRWNMAVVNGSYSALSRALPQRLEELARAAGLAASLSALNVPQSDLPALAEDAARQWTGRFNPRPLDAAAALEIYQCAW